VKPIDYPHFDILFKNWSSFIDHARYGDIPMLFRFRLIPSRFDEFLEDPTRRQNEAGSNLDSAFI
jgi:hypothetical protein